MAGPTCFGWLATALAILGGCTELLQNPSLGKVFRTLAPTAGKRLVLGQLPGETTTGIPVWELDQRDRRVRYQQPARRRLGHFVVSRNPAAYRLITLNPR